jgi:hypothetical protein
LNEERLPGSDRQVYFRDPHVIPGIGIKGVAAVKNGVFEPDALISQRDVHAFCIKSITAAGFLVDEVPEAVFAAINEEEPKQADAHQQEKSREEKCQEYTPFLFGR